MADDQIGIGYAHTMNPYPFPLRDRREPRNPETIARRWDSRWEPECVLAAKRTDNPVEEFSVLRFRFNLRVRRLLAAGLEWRTIVASDYDSPLSTGTEFDRKLCLAIERRRVRMGRVKGKGKYANRRRSRRQ